MAIAKQTEHLARKMESRHIQMISLGGVIGTGLFLSSGYTIHQAGPLGTVLAYFVGALIVYSVMLCLGELSVAMPLIPVRFTCMPSAISTQQPALSSPFFIG